MDLGKRSYISALRFMDVAKLMEDLPETHGGLCEAEYKMLEKRQSEYFSVPSMGNSGRKEKDTGKRKIILSLFFSVF